MKLTDCRGAEVAFEVVGIPRTFELAAELICPRVVVLWAMAARQPRYRVDRDQYFPR